MTLLTGSTTSGSLVISTRGDISPNRHVYDDDDEEEEYLAYAHADLSLSLGTCT
jgi:hypothetical protein